MIERKRYNVGAHKIAHARRDVAHAVLTEDDPRGFLDIIGADTDDEDTDHPLGAPVTYSVELTDDEAARFRSASNCRYVEEDTVAHPVVGATAIPTPRTMTWMEAPASDTVTWHGRDVPVAVLDQGTTKSVRDYMGYTLVQRKVFGDDPSPKEIWTGSNHGCLVAPNAVPTRGKLYDVLVTNKLGAAPISSSAAAMRWAADQGVKILNYSYGATAGSSVWTDAFTYLAGKGSHLYVAAGNNNQATLAYPAAYSSTYTNVHSVIAFDETTGKRAAFSNYSSAATGCAPGVNVTSLAPTAKPVLWSGTSAAAPHTASLAARLCTGGTFTATQAANALRAYTRDTGQPTSYQGGGAFSFHQALTALLTGASLPGSSSSAPPLVATRLVDGQFAGVSDFIDDIAQEIDWLGGTCAVRRITQVDSAPANADILVSWQAVDVDSIGGMWDPLAPTYITIRVAGTYSIDCIEHYNYQGNTSGPYITGTRAGRIMLNGTNPATNSLAVDKKPWSVDGEGVVLAMTATTRCAVGDRIYAGYRHTASGPIICLTNDLGGTVLSVTRTGP